jgi:glucokinase
VASIERLARQRYGRGIQAYQIITAARQGNDPIAIEIMEQIGIYLGLALASLCAIFLPERVALTGGTTHAGPVLLEACQNKFKELVDDYHRTIAELTGDYYNGVKIVFGEQGSEAGVLGAVVEFFQQKQAN